MGIPREESQAGTSDQNASSKFNFAPVFQTDGQFPKIKLEFLNSMPPTGVAT